MPYIALFQVQDNAPALFGCSSMARTTTSFSKVPGKLNAYLAMESTTLFPCWFEAPQLRVCFSLCAPPCLTSILSSVLLSFYSYFLKIYTMNFTFRSYFLIFCSGFLKRKKCFISPYWASKGTRRKHGSWLRWRCWAATVYSSSPWANLWQDSWVSLRW